MQYVAQGRKCIPFLLPFALESLAASAQVPHGEVINESGDGACRRLEPVGLKSFCGLAYKLVEACEYPAVENIGALPITRRAIFVEFIKCEHVAQASAVLLHDLVHAFPPEAPTLRSHDG